MAGIYSQTAIANFQGFDTTFTSEYDTNQTATTILTPTSGKSIEVKGVYVGSVGVTGQIRLYFATSNNTIFISLGVNGPGGPGYVPLLVSGQRNEPIKMTSTLGADNLYFVLINYTEK